MDQYLEVQSNIGINCRKPNCMTIHPSEMHMIYAVGCMLVVKSVDSETDRYLPGHYSIITTVTCSYDGNLLASGEAYDHESEQTAALIVWDFKSLEILYRVRYHKQVINGLSFNCTESLLASLGGKQDNFLVVIWNMDEGKSEVF